MSAGSDEAEKSSSDSEDSPDLTSKSSFATTSAASSASAVTAGKGQAKPPSTTALKLTQATKELAAAAPIHPVPAIIIEEAQGDKWDDLFGKGAWSDVSARLTKRKVLVERRRRLVDAASVFAFSGLALMVLAAELIIQGVVARDGDVAMALRVIVSALTLVLVGTTFLYHRTGIQQSLVDCGLRDWRLLVTRWRCLTITFEMLVCAVHPPPGSPLLMSEAVESSLCLFMFCRCYLIARLFLVHSHVGTDASTRSLGALNKVPIDEMFVFRAIMTEWPGTFLLFWISLIFFLGSWCIRLCEWGYVAAGQSSSSEAQAGHLVEAMWLTAITLLTVGYGDVTPKSECGRLSAVIVGTLGVLLTALLVAVMAQKLEQSRAERYVHTFVSRMRLDKLHKHAAADLIKQAVVLWKVRRMPEGHRKQRRRLRAYGKLLQAVRTMRMTRAAKAQAGEAAVGVLEVNRSVEEVARTADNISDQQNHLLDRVEEIEDRLASIEEKLGAVLEAVKPKAANQKGPDVLPDRTSIKPATLTVARGSKTAEASTDFELVECLEEAARHGFDVHEIKTKVRRLEQSKRALLGDPRRNQRLKKMVVSKKKGHSYLLAESDDIRFKYDHESGERIYCRFAHESMRLSMCDRLDTTDLEVFPSISANDPKYLNTVEVITKDLHVLQKFIVAYTEWLRLT